MTNLHIEQLTNVRHGDQVATEGLYISRGWGVIKVLGGITRMEHSELISLHAEEEEQKARDQAKNLNATRAFADYDSGDVDCSAALTSEHYTVEHLVLEGVKAQIRIVADYSIGNAPEVL